MGRNSNRAVQSVLPSINNNYGNIHIHIVIINCIFKREMKERYFEFKQNDSAQQVKAHKTGKESSYIQSITELYANIANNFDVNSQDCKELCSITQGSDMTEAEVAAKHLEDSLEKVKKKVDEVHPLGPPLDAEVILAKVNGLRLDYIKVYRWVGKSRWNEYKNERMEFVGRGGNNLKI
eukprot:Nk52_evm50s2531 gene=Nk52_evmTU50s2531